MHVAEPSYCCACSGVVHIDRPARKKGDERNSWVSEYSSSNVPTRCGGMTTYAEEGGHRFHLSVRASFDDFLRDVMCRDARTFWTSSAFWPRSVDAAIRSIEFWMDAMSSPPTTTLTTAVPVASTMVVVASSSSTMYGAESGALLSNWASRSDLWNDSVARSGPLLLLARPLGGHHDHGLGRHGHRHDKGEKQPFSLKGQEQCVWLWWSKSLPSSHL